MIVLPQTVPPPAVIADARPPAASIADRAALVIVPRHDCDASGSDVTVCGRRNQETFRLRPLVEPPRRPNILGQPLAIQIAPGVTFGFGPGGLGLRAGFGPGAKPGAAPAAQNAPAPIARPDQPLPSPAPAP